MPPKAKPGIPGNPRWHFDCYELRQTLTAAGHGAMGGVIAVLSFAELFDTPEIHNYLFAKGTAAATIAGGVLMFVRAFNLWRADNRNKAA
jgi:hypothetical protein